MNSTPLIRKNGFIDYRNERIKPVDSAIKDFIKSAESIQELIEMSFVLQNIVSGNISEKTLRISLEMRKEKKNDN